MKLSPEQVKHIAALARLNLTAQEQEKYGEQLSAILSYMDKLQTIDTGEVAPTSQVTGLTNVMREDEINPSGIAEALVACAPLSGDGFIKVPKIFVNK